MTTDGGARALHVGSGEGLRLVLVRVGAMVCGLRAGDVIETMRPLPIASVSGVPEFVLGLSIIRGRPTPVVDAARLVGAAAAPISRFVSVETGARTVALAVSSVIGLRVIESAAFGELPPLTASMSSDAVSAVGRLDESLLLVLEASKLVPDPLPDAS
jgi:purine-binding chemotaxis protein CheW